MFGGHAQAGGRVAGLVSLVLVLGALAAGTANAAASQWNPIGSYTIAFTARPAAPARTTTR